MRLLTGISTLLAACVLGGVLLSGKALINFNHTPKFDQLFQYEYYRFDYSYNRLNVYLTDRIHVRDGYLSLIQLINKNKDKEVYFYLAGNGGRVNSTMSLWYTLKAHPKKVTTIVYSDVYSAHAFLAFAGHDIKIVDPGVLFLFHVPAIKEKNSSGAIKVEKFCEKQKGKDRGVSNKLKCFRMWEKQQEQYLYTIENALYIILSEEELENYYNGHDVIINGAVVLEKLKK